MMRRKPIARGGRLATTTGGLSPGSQAHVYTSLERVPIVVAICSCGKNRERRDAVRQTWLSRPAPGVKCVFFVGRGAEITGEDDVLVVDADDSYDYLPQKVRAAFASILSTYDCDWIFKCDDDTYVALDRLQAIITRADAGLIGDVSLDNRGSPSGGAGYFLSAETAAKIVADKESRDVGPEDILIGRQAARLGARMVASPALCKDRSRLPSADNQLASCHWCDPSHLRIIHELMTDSALRVVRAEHRHWRDDLLLLPSGNFTRKSSGCMGRWSEPEAGKLRLDWKQWGTEEFVATDAGYVSSTVLDGDKDRRWLPASPAGQTKPRLPNLPWQYSHTLVISLPGSARKQPALARAVEFSHEVVWSPGVLVDPASISWQSINGMEAYGSIANFRNRYIPAALGCRLAGLAALERGVELAEADPRGAPGFIVLEDDFVLKDPDLFLLAFADLPADADALWLDCLAVNAPSHDLEGTCLRRIMGARRCTAFWMSTKHARAIIPGLRACSSEWDLFMQRQMPKGLYYAPRTTIFDQLGGVSDITGNLGPG
jgi:hypothetical protein